MRDPHSNAQFGLKRLFDLAVVLSTSCLWLPLVGFLAVLARGKLGSPVLFIQPRPGYAGHVFPLFKFRTMTDARDASGNLVPDADRLVPFGRWLRSTSLDELPELFNILAGHMSLVGPRPLLVRYLSRYSKVQAVRHDVRPGLTGWAQINGRNAVSWKRRFDLDHDYVVRRSLGFDLRILMGTMTTVFRRHGISDAGQATKEEFRGEEAVIAEADVNLSPRNPSVNAFLS